VLGCILYAAGYFSVALAPGFGMLVLSMLVNTGGEVVFSPTSTAVVANMAPPERIDRYMGLFGLTEAIGWSAGPFVGGILIDVLHHVPIVMWCVIGAMGTAATVGFGVTMRTSRRSVKQEGDDA
jgi:MFS family permease